MSDLQNKLYELLQNRYSSVVNQDTSVLYSRVLIHDDPVKRNLEFLELIKKSFNDQDSLPPLPPTGGYKPFQGSSNQQSNESLSQKDLDDFIYGRNTSVSLGLDSISLDLLSFEDESISPILMKQYHKFVGGFTDDWQQYLRRDDGRFVGLKSGRFNQRNAYKSELSPNIFYKDVAVIRESDLKVFMFVDVSGSTSRDLKEGGNKIDLSLYESDELKKILTRKSNTNATRNIAREVLPPTHYIQNTSSAYYCTALGVAISNVLELGGCTLDFNFFRDYNIHISNTIYNEKLLPKFFSSLSHNHGGGTELTESLKYLSKVATYTNNRDKLMLVLTDGAIGNSSELVESCTSLHADFGLKFLFVGIGCRIDKELYKIPHFETFSYESGNDMINRFPADFSSFVFKKYFQEE
jgi:hypothetical protein